jgi:vacuolar-type H+-ATPase subunit I/STV1
MEIVHHPQKSMETSWSEAWAFVTYKKKFLIASILFGVILLYYPYFFSFIQHRHGMALNDPLLNILPSFDVSVYIFPLIYSTVSLGLLRAVRSPSLFLLFLWSFLFFSLSRIITITLVPLEPPTALVPLADPLLVPFYRHNNITKDLFYSGHTGSVFLIYLFLTKKWEKIYALIATVLVGILLLIQHIHYTMDVLFAPFFVYLIFILAKKVTNV